jgi:hypothetical protein
MDGGACVVTYLFSTSIGFPVIFGNRVIDNEQWKVLMDWYVAPKLSQKGTFICRNF